MELGSCQLCGEERTQLVAGHIWPKFVYKQYVSNVTKGGSFVDLTAGKVTNRQHKRYWFCADCDGKVLGEGEKYAAEFCRAVDSDPTGVQEYTAELVKFATSISWRTTRHVVRERAAPKLRSLLKGPCKRWKEYLQGRRPNVGPYTQHLYIVFDPNIGFHRGLGGQVFEEERLVLSQVGPLFIVGLLDRKQLSQQDRTAWSHSQLHHAGGKVNPVTEWREGITITPDFRRLLQGHQRGLVEAAQRRANRSAS